MHTRDDGDHAVAATAKGGMRRGEGAPPLPFGWLHRGEKSQRAPFPPLPFFPLFSEEDGNKSGEDALPFEEEEEEEGSLVSTPLEAVDDGKGPPAATHWHGVCEGDSHGSQKKKRGAN